MSETLSKEISRKEALKIQSFLKTGYGDYLASRILINHNLLLQGTILANTSIEKYLKAILTFKDDKFKFTHKTTVLLEELKDFDDKLYDQINKQFVNLIEQSYKLRYIDALPVGFRVALVRRNVLAELDFTVSLFANKIQLNLNPNSSSNDTKYFFDKKNKSSDLYLNNFILNELPKNEFLLGIDDVYEFINDENGNFIEVIYQSDIKN